MYGKNELSFSQTQERWRREKKRIERKRGEERDPERVRFCFQPVNINWADVRRQGCLYFQTFGNH